MNAQLTRQIVNDLEFQFKKQEDKIRELQGNTQQKSTEKQAKTP